jgi:hypothetical protein
VRQLAAYFFGDIIMTLNIKLIPLSYLKHQRCCDCFGWKYASVLQVMIGANWTRHRYFCSDCATARSLLQSKYLIGAIQSLQRDRTKTTAQPQQKAKAGERGK